MMGKTHLAMGIATSLLIMHPTSPKSCIIAIVGGALGGVIADIDIIKNDYKHDALIGQLAAVGISLVALLLDFFFGLGICREVIDSWSVLKIIGLVGYVVLGIIGFSSPHRTFTHSLLSLVLFSVSILLIYPPSVIAYGIGYLSHILLDILNKKKVPVFFPFGKGICLKLFGANGVGNTVFMVVGIVASVALIINATVFLFF